MPPVRGKIKDYVAGDRLDVRRQVKNIPSGRQIVYAWMTFKQDKNDPDPGMVQKKITSAAAGGVGQITDTGADGTGEVLFQLTSADTLYIGWEYTRYYDIQLKFDDGDIATLEIGEIELNQGVTDALV